MKAAFIAAYALLIAGCASSIESSRARETAAVYASNLSQAALTHCLTGKLEFMGSPTVIPGDDSTEIAFKGEFGTELLVTMHPAAAGSQIELRFKHQNYIDHVRRAVEACA